MRFLVIGLGSMGKRRIRNLQYLKAEEILGFDTREYRCKEAEANYGIKTFKKLEEALSEDPDAFIISTPPDLHLDYALIATEQNKHFFIEASVVADGMDELIALCKGKNIIAAPSCTMRFHPSVKRIKELVDNKVIGDILAFTYHSGQYLPDWHPWEDYRSFYVARKETGACREIVPFELTWLTWILGDIDCIACFKDKLTNLEVEIDDIYQILMKFKNGVLGHMLVDVISRTPYRVCKLISEEGVITWDWGAGVKVYTAKDRDWKEYTEEQGTTVEGYTDKIKEEPYIEEMRHFIEAIRGEIRYPYTLEEDKRILNILYAAEKSSERGVHVIL
jgi:predicted dehydrogenase